MYKLYSGSHGEDQRSIWEKPALGSIDENGLACVKFICDPPLFDVHFLAWGSFSPSTKLQRASRFSTSFNILGFLSPRDHAKS